MRNRKLGQGAHAVFTQLQRVRHQAALRHGSNVWDVGLVDEQLGLRVQEQVSYFGGAVGRIDRHINQPGAQTGQIEIDRFGSFIELR